MLKVVRFKDNKEYIERILNRSQFEFQEVNNAVKSILENVKEKRDEALREYTLKFDGAYIEEFKVSNDEIEEAFKEIDENLKRDLLKAKENIESYHRYQIRGGYSLKKEQGVTLKQLIKPISKVGIYVPGGSAAYPSTVLMNAIPAKLAGVKEIVMITPPNEEGKIKESILVAAAIAGVDKIYKVGGAQGIAALTFGTESVSKVNKIVGPGNIYVAMAKKSVAGYVGIDMVAGPSEILILADSAANPKYIAADLMSQAEHDEMASAILITDSMELAEKVREELESQIVKLERKEIIEKSLKSFGAIILIEKIDEAINIVNEIAPEHLEIMTQNPLDIYEKVENAGAIFIGEYSPEPVGDYFAGTNHTLPTSATARFSSPLGVDDFIKKTSFVNYSEEALRKDKDSIIRIANSEGLTAHANAIKVRFEEE